MISSTLPPCEAKTTQQTQPLDGLRGELGVQLSRAIGIHPIQCPPEHIVVEMFRLNPRTQSAFYGLVLEKQRGQIQSAVCET
jgi:hypothetical protein